MPARDIELVDLNYEDGDVIVSVTVSSHESAVRLATAFASVARWTPCVREGSNSFFFSDESNEGLRTEDFNTILTIGRENELLNEKDTAGLTLGMVQRRQYQASFTLKI
jgi:hypothetical protein